MPAKGEGFNERIGLDLKYLPGWKPNHKIPWVDIDDYGSSFQQIIPLYARETAETLRQAYRQFWLSWARVPQELILDPSQPNLAEALCSACESEGTRVRHTAADAHWQAGKVERHGGLFARVFVKVLHNNQPTNESAWRECVTQALSAKNTMFNVAGVSPCQFVFGRNPRTPSDLLQENPDIIASDASSCDHALRRQAEIRLSARRAMVASQDCKALREALRARLRVTKEFVSGQWVAYWRTQKFDKGTIIRGGRWYGPALVLGKVGRNAIIAHRRSLLRCAPEQLRPVTEEERPVSLETEERELLGMKQLLNQGRFPKNQLVDLSSSDQPPSVEEALPPLPVAEPGQAGLTAAELLQGQQPIAAIPSALPASSGVPEDMLPYTRAGLPKPGLVPLPVPVQSVDPQSCRQRISWRCLKKSCPRF